MTILLIFLGALIISGCIPAARYQVKDIAYGYSHSIQEGGKYLVLYESREQVDLVKVGFYALYRSAELAIELKKPYFIIHDFDSYFARGQFEYFSCNGGMSFMDYDSGRAEFLVSFFASPGEKKPQMIIDAQEFLNDNKAGLNSDNYLDVNKYLADKGYVFTPYQLTNDGGNQDI